MNPDDPSVAEAVTNSMIACLAGPSTERVDDLEGDDSSLQLNYKPGLG